MELKITILFLGKRLKKDFSSSRIKKVSIKHPKIKHPKIKIFIGKISDIHVVNELESAIPIRNVSVLLDGIFQEIS